MRLFGRIACFGGVYNNHYALRAAIEDAGRRGVERMLCLGDLGAFGPNPDKVFPLLIDNGVEVMQGNYDNSIGNNLSDCQCGYTDPADNHYARLSYQYTYRKTSEKWRAWLAGLAGEIRFELRCADVEGGLFGDTRTVGQAPPYKSGARRVLCCHGSPRRMNEFLWESTTPTHLLEKFCDDFQADVIVATHTGLPWVRKLSNGRLFVNCGVLGRPANDGTTRVGYSILNAGNPAIVEYVPLEYDHEALAREMEEEALPAPFVETVRTGWWTTCLEILPGKERGRGRY